MPSEKAGRILLVGTNEADILAGCASVCAHLQRNGMVLVMVSNKSDVTRGRISRGTVQEINTFLYDCDCRKPQTGDAPGAGLEY